MELYRGIKGRLRLKGQTVEYFSSFPAQLRFKCLPDCGLCCSSYKIPLTGEDINRINRSHKTGNKGCISLVNERKEDIAGYINNGPEKGCSYLSGDKSCLIYSSRPLYCRTFPFIRDSYFMLEMSMDYSCPGIGAGDEITNESIEEMFILELKNRGNRLNIEEAVLNFSFAVSALKSMNIYTEYDCIIFIMNELIRHCLTGNQSLLIIRGFKLPAPHLEQVLQGRGNIETKEAAESIVEELTPGAIPDQGVPDQSERPLLPIRFHIDDKPLKICLFNQKIPHYELSYEKGCFYISGKNMEKKILPALEIKGGEVCADAVKRLSEYLMIWLSRQSLLRFSHSVGLASFQRANIFKSYFNFISFAVERLLLTAEVLKILNERDSISESIMKEAIRSNDNLLRSKCLSMITVN